MNQDDIVRNKGIGFYTCCQKYVPTQHLVLSTQHITVTSSASSPER